MKRVVEVIDLDPIDMGDNESLKFRVEIFEEKNANAATRYGAKIFRYETFRLSPSFPVEAVTDREIWDKEILVADEHLGFMDFTGNSVQSVLSSVLSAIKSFTEHGSLG